MKPIPTIAALLTLLLCQLSAPAACGRCCVVQPTIRQEIGECQLVVVGSVAHPREHPENGMGPAGGATDLLIEGVLKGRPHLKGARGLIIPRHVPIDKQPAPRFLVFCSMDNGQIDPYRGILSNGPNLIDYVKGIIALDAKDAAGALKYFFRYLRHADPEISGDAFKEFAQGEYRDLRALAPKLPAETFVKWLNDPDTPPQQCGLCGFLLGHCGTKEHADLLWQKLDDANLGTAADRLLVGAVLLRPRESWPRLRALLKDPAAEFLRATTPSAPFASSATSGPKSSRQRSWPPPSPTCSTSPTSPTSPSRTCAAPNDGKCVGASWPSPS